MIASYIVIKSYIYYRVNKLWFMLWFKIFLLYLMVPEIQRTG